MDRTVRDQSLETPLTAVDQENRVRQQLAPELADYHAPLQAAYGYLGMIVDSGNVPQPPLAAKVGIILAARLQADLRAVDLLATVGYALQAMTIASAVREIAVAIMYVAADDKRARDWIGHDKERKSYPENYKDALKEVLPKYFDVDSGAVDREYRVYTEMCWAKHGNPILQRVYGITYTAETANIDRQPNASSFTLWTARVAMAEATRAALWAVGAFAECHYALETAKAFIERTAVTMNSLHERMAHDGLLQPGEKSTLP